MNIQKEFMLQLALKQKRLDGRGFLDFREITIEKNPIEKAEGSARVRMGNTDIIAGVKMEVGKPFGDKPDEGVLIVNAELSPMAAADFEPGPPREPAIELARVVDRGIRESHAIDTKKLCIEEGEKVWMVNIDTQIVNHDGNLIDAFGLAAIAALCFAKIPAYDGTKVDYLTHKEALPVTAVPVPITVTKLADGTLVVDPTREEEDFAEARLTVTTMENGNVSALQKGGAPLSLEEIESAIAIAGKKAKELRKMI